MGRLTWEASLVGPVGVPCLPPELLTKWGARKATWASLPGALLWSVGCPGPWLLGHPSGSFCHGEPPLLLSLGAEAPGSLAQMTALPHPATALGTVPLLHHLYIAQFGWAIVSPLQLWLKQLSPLATDLALFHLSLLKQNNYNQTSENFHSIYVQNIIC